MPIERMAPDRIITNFHAEAEGMTPDKIVGLLLKNVSKPRPEDYR